MIALIKDLPENVVGFKVGGTVTGDDYEKVLIPAVEEKLKHFEKIRVLYQVGDDFDKYEFSALIDDAKLGLGNFFSWDRIAVVSDVSWIADAAKVFGFMMPAKMKLFSGDELKDAKSWISEKRNGMEITIDGNMGIAMLEPHDPIDKSDFERAEKLIDPYIQSNGELTGLIIHAKTFPGWESAGAFMAHMNFIRTHHKHVKKLALVTDSKMIDIAKSIAGYFVDVEVKQFGADELEAAKEWILSRQ